MHLLKLLTRSLVKLNNDVKVFPFLNPCLPEFSDRQNQKKCDPILVTVMGMQPHCSQSVSKRTKRIIKQRLCRG